MDWNDINSIEELQNLGSFKVVKEKLKLRLGFEVPSRGWNDLFEKLQAIKDLFLIEDAIKVDSGELVNMPDTPYAKYFKSNSDWALFCLLELDGKDRQKIIGAKPNLYKDSELAKKWYRNISRLVHPDKLGTEKANVAMAVLSKMYQEMIRR